MFTNPYPRRRGSRHPSSAGRGQPLPFPLRDPAVCGRRWGWREGAFLSLSRADSSMKRGAEGGSSLPGQSQRVPGQCLLALDLSISGTGWTWTLDREISLSDRREHETEQGGRSDGPSSLPFLTGPTSPVCTTEPLSASSPSSPSASPADPAQLAGTDTQGRWPRLELLGRAEPISPRKPHSQVTDCASSTQKCISPHLFHSLLS